MKNSMLNTKRQLEAGKSIYEIPLRVCYYARVSTDKDEQLNSLENQVGYFTDFIQGKESWEYAGGYIDEGLSGKSVEKRANFLRMINDAKDGKFDLIITKEISRFSRSTLDSIKYTQELLSYGVGVFFQSDNINTLMPDSELRLTIMASIAQEEVRKLSERLRFGYRRSIEKGRVLGQNNLLGYSKQDGKLTIIEEEAELVRKIFEIYTQGKMGVRRIARELEAQGIISPNTGKALIASSIAHIIQNPKYKGYYCSGKTISLDYRQNKRVRIDADEWNVYKDDSIPAIVSEELWDKANELYKARGQKAKNNADAYSQRYSFSGKIVCADHGTSYHRHVYKSIKNGEQEVWNCKLYRQKGKIDGCDSPTIYTKEIKKILEELYETIYYQRETVISGLMEIYTSAGIAQDHNKEISKKQAAIDKLEKSKNQLLDLLMENFIDKQEFKRRNDLLSADIENIQSEIEEIEKEAKLQKKNKADLSNIKEALEKAFAENGNFNEELNFLLLNKIIVHKVGGSKSHIRLEIVLNLGLSYLADVKDSNCISLVEIGISQAQVSRLEKNALKNMKKYIG